MSAQACRLARGGRIDRSRPLSFTFDGHTYSGFLGDTLASALLANGVHLIGRSFKYHRPRRHLQRGARGTERTDQPARGRPAEPNVAPTTVELFEGLEAHSQNHWPSLGFDMMNVIDRFSRVLRSRFLLQDIHGPVPPRLDGLREDSSGGRRDSGIPRSNGTPIATRKAMRSAMSSCSWVAARRGSSPRWPPDAVGRACCLGGGRGGPARGVAALAAEWRRDRCMARCGGRRIAKALPNVRLMTRTTAFGAYDNLVFGLIERVGDHLPVPGTGQPRQRYWILRTRQALLATGMLERPIVFGNNDLPGVMLASAGASYVNRHAVVPGRKIVVFTNNDTAYRAALDLAAAGADVAVVDIRGAISPELGRAAREAKIALHLGCAVARANGGKRVRSADVCAFDSVQAKIGTAKLRLPCDLLLVSGGWTPTLQLLGQRGARPVYDEKRTMLVAERLPRGNRVAGSASGELRLQQRVISGLEAGCAAAEACGFTAQPDRESAGAKLPDERAHDGHRARRGDSGSSGRRTQEEVRRFPARCRL